LCTETALEGPGLGMRFGMYQGAEIHPALAGAVRAALVKPFIDDLERGQGGSRTYDPLTLYLLLTHPQGGEEPGPDGHGWKPARTFIVSGVREYWARRSPTGISAPGKKAVEKLLRMYLLEAEDADEPTLFFKRDTSAVDAARKALNGGEQVKGIDKLLSEV